MGFFARDKHRLLVTGSHRSGTTWVGRILASHPELRYVLEPLNVTHGPAVMRAANKHCYRYICPENEGSFLKPLQTVLRAGCQAKDCRSNHGWHRGTLIKDPFAIFSGAWFASRLGYRSVITVRHPVSLIGSLRRLGWHFDHRHLTEQPLLMRDWLEPFRSELEAVIAAPSDLIGQSCLLWRMLYTVARLLQRDVPGTIILRHEDLSRDPWHGFATLFDRLGLDMTASTRRTIHELTNAANPAEASVEQQHDNTIVALDSRANLDNWKHRLSGDEVRRILDLTADVASLYYSAEEIAGFAAESATADSTHGKTSPPAASTRPSPVERLPGRLSLADLPLELPRHAPGRMPIIPIAPDTMAPLPATIRALASRAASGAIQGHSSSGDASTHPESTSPHASHA